MWKKPARRPWMRLWIALASALFAFAGVAGCSPVSNAIASSMDVAQMLESGAPVRAGADSESEYRAVNGAMVVAVRFPGSDREWKFIVDSAAPTLLDNSVANALGLKPYRTIYAADFAGKIQRKRNAKVESLAVGEARVNDLIVLVADLKKETPVGGIDGLLGVNFLRHFVVTVDPAANRIYFSPVGRLGKARFAAESARPGAAILPLQETRELPGMLAVEARIDKRQPPLPFLVDTGNGGPIVVPPELADAGDYRLGGAGVRAIKGFAGAAAFGKIAGGRLFRMADVELGGVDFGPCAAYAVKTVAPGIGMGFLGQFRFTIDAAGKKLILAPGSRKTRLDRIYSVGLGVIRKGGLLQVEALVADSPADRAGLRIGDQIVKINGRDAGPEAETELARLEADDNAPRYSIAVRTADEAAREIMLEKVDLLAPAR